MPVPSIPSLSSNFCQFCFLAWPPLALPRSLPTLDTASKDKRQVTKPAHGIHLQSRPPTTIYHTKNIVESGGVESDSWPVFRPAPSYRSRSPRASRSVRIPSTKKKGRDQSLDHSTVPGPQLDFLFMEPRARARAPRPPSRLPAVHSMHTICRRITAPRTYAS